MTGFIMNIGLDISHKRRYIPEQLRTAPGRTKQTLYCLLMASKHPVKVAIRVSLTGEQTIVATGEYSGNVMHLADQLAYELCQDCVAVWTLDTGIVLRGPDTALYEPATIDKFLFQ